ncbi:MAG: hypothetical protein ACI935_001239 [Moritella dasanensis]|jgi:hypothetical protein
MKISIIKNDTDLVIASYQINLDTLDHTPSDEEYYSQAWLHAIEDDIVEENDYAKYSFKI